MTTEPAASGQAPAPPSAEVYEERARWTRYQQYLTALCLLGVLTFFLELELPLFVRVATITVFGVATVWSVIVPVTRLVVVRVDAAGITLGGSPFRRRSTTRVIPWPEVKAVFLWHRPYLGVRLFVERTPDAPPLTPDGRGPADRQAVVVPAGAPYPWPNLKIGTGRGLQSVTFDEARFAAVIARHAPTVPVGRLVSTDSGPLPVTLQPEDAE